MRAVRLSLVIWSSFYLTGGFAAEASKDCNVLVDPDERAACIRDRPITVDTFHHKHGHRPHHPVVSKKPSGDK
jgi:hypothetical protein